LHNAIESIKRGAFHFISKPYAPEELLSLAEKALEKSRCCARRNNCGGRRNNLEKRLELGGDASHSRFQSKAMQEIDELIEAMAPSEANVLIIGESGTGKEVSPTIFTGAAGALENRWETQLRGVSPDSHRSRAVWLCEVPLPAPRMISRDDCCGQRRHTVPG